MKIVPVHDNGRIFGGTLKEDSGKEIASFSVQVHRRLQPHEAVALAAAVRGFLSRAGTDLPDETA